MGKVLYGVDEFGEKLEGGVYITEQEMVKQRELSEKRRQYFKQMQQENILRIDFTEILGEFYFVNYRKLLKMT